MPTLFFCAPIRRLAGNVALRTKECACAHTYVRNPKQCGNGALRSAEEVRFGTQRHVRTGGLTAASLRTYVRAADGQWHYVRTYVRTRVQEASQRPAYVRACERTYVLAFATGIIMTEARTHRILTRAKTCSEVHTPKSLARTGSSHVL